MSSVSANPELERLRYPIGRFHAPEVITAEEIEHSISSLEQLPADLRKAVEDLTEEQLERPYRPGGWTVRQVVHHIPDSHMNSYVRFRWALTEENPTIKTYDEQAWAMLADAKSAPVEISLRLLGALHARWTMLLRSLGEREWERVFTHPEWGKVSVARSVALYAWHGRHHLAQIDALREREGW